MGKQPASKIYKTKRTKKETDQILSNDLNSKASIDSLKHQKFDEYLPGLGQHYCIPCAKYYDSEIALKSHQKSKIHKRQLKNIKFGPYTPEEAAAGAGHNVAKYMLNQQNQLELLGSADTAQELSVEKGKSHLKRRQKVASGEMELENQEVLETDATKDVSPVEEISV